MSTGNRLFNTPLETSIRLLILLGAAYPRSLSLDRLVMLDHVLVHTSDFGGPPSVHPASPYRAAEPYVRRELIQRSLVLLRSRELALEIPTDDGFVWQAGEPAAPFIELLTTKYHQTLRARASWTMNAFGATSEIDLASAMGERAISAIGIGLAG
jgi:hypothetical protein